MADEKRVTRRSALQTKPPPGPPAALEPLSVLAPDSYVLLADAVPADAVQYDDAGVSDPNSGLPAESHAPVASEFTAAPPAASGPSAWADADWVYAKLHRYPELLEKRGARLEREKLIHERQNLQFELEELRSRAWLFSTRPYHMLQHDMIEGSTDSARLLKIAGIERKLARYNLLLNTKPTDQTQKATGEVVSARIKLKFGNVPIKTVVANPVGSVASPTRPSVPGAAGEARHTRKSRNGTGAVGGDAVSERKRSAASPSSNRRDTTTPALSPGALNGSGKPRRETRPPAAYSPSPTPTRDSSMTRAERLLKRTSQTHDTMRANGSSKKPNTEARAKDKMSNGEDKARLANNGTKAKGKLKNESTDESGESGSAERSSRRLSSRTDGDDTTTRDTRRPRTSFFQSEVLRLSVAEQMEHDKANSRRSSARVSYAFGVRAPENQLIKYFDFTLKGGSDAPNEKRARTGRPSLSLEEMCIERIELRIKEGKLDPYTPSGFGYGLFTGVAVSSLK